MIAPPPDSDKNSIKIQIYLLGTEDSIEAHVSQTNKVNDVIRHTMTMFKKKFPNKKLKYANDPEAYELRIVDDDDEDDAFKPSYEVSALDKDE